MIKTEEEIAKDFFSAMTSEDIYDVKQIPDSKFMVIFHMTVGLYIRNAYGLWDTPHTPVIVNGVDVSPKHPDAISSNVLELIWKYCNEA